MVPTRIVVLGDGGLAAAIVAGLVEARLDEVVERPLDAAVEAADLVIAAPEGVTFAALDEALGAWHRAAAATLVVAIDRGALTWGPIAAPGVSACLECQVRRAIDGEPDPEAARQRIRGSLAGTAAEVPPARLQALARGLAHELAALFRGDPGRLFTTRAIHGASERRVFTLPHPECERCEQAPTCEGPVHRAALAVFARLLELDGVNAELRHAPPDPAHPEAIRTVTIVGGGTAGYLAALGLRARLPWLEVTLVESSQIPIIRVGEATTPELVKFLHGPSQLGLDVVDFYRRVRPTFKLGIRFLWGEPGDGEFHYPFQFAPLVDPQVHDGRLHGQSLASLLMESDRAPVIGDPAGGPAHSLLESIRFAYHLDNESFVRYLQTEARRLGVRHIDAKVVAVELRDGGQEVDHLVLDDGRRLAADLFVDASGFRSLLLEGALGSGFVSYASSLFTDRAIAAVAPNGGLVKPYTRAHTFSSGWCWTIPFEHEDHLGYVYSSSFLGDDEALAEMRRVHPELSDPRPIRFRSGRHEHFIRGNVVAIGNAYAFVEPLESTALHMIVYELDHLTNHFPGRRDVATRAHLNRTMNGLWDQLRWFLAIHYRFNRRLDTPFWRAAREHADIRGVEDRIALFRERAPLSDRPSFYYSVAAPDFFADDHAFDTLLLGQGVAARLGSPRSSRAAWRQRAALRERVIAQALPQAAALPLLRDQQPDLLRRFVESPGSWVRHWLAR